MRKTKIVLGLDLSLRSSGVIKLENDKIINQRLIKSKPTGKLPIDELKRLMAIRDEVDIENISLVVIEGIAFGIRKTTSLSQLSALNYMVREKCYSNKVPFIIVAPTTLKKFITGKGNIKKDVILLEIFKRYDIEFYDDNLGDAYGLAKIGESILNEKTDSPVFQTEVIKLLNKQIRR